jgi:hypothetical protein
MEPGDPFHSVRNVPRSGAEQTRAWDAYNRTWSPGSFVPRASGVKFTAAIHLEDVATIPSCAECEAHWLPADEARWQAWLTDDGQH